MRITHIVTKGWPMGGSQRDTLALMRCQQQRHEVQAIVGGEGPLVTACQDDGIPTLIIPMRNRAINPVGDIQAILTLAVALRRQQPDIAHTHTSKAGVLGRIAARLAGVSIIIHTVHSPPVHDRQHPLVRGTSYLAERLCSALTHHFITVADGQRRQIIASGISPSARITTIPFGIDLNDFPVDPAATRSRIRQTLGIADDAFVTISIGELTPDKGFDLLIQTALAIRRSSRAVFLIAGTGMLAGQLAAEIKAHALGEGVRLLGPRDDIPDLLAAADVYLQTSWREGLSRALIEAMFSGLPVIATDAGATADVVHDGETGLLVSRGDVPAIIDRLQRLLNDAEQRATLGRRAQAFVEGRWSMEAYCQAHEQLYRELVERQKG
jgi:glycosyltransferase involved in cell wall biosynthesis